MQNTIGKKIIYCVSEETARLNRILPNINKEELLEDVIKNFNISSILKEENIMIDPAKVHLQPFADNLLLKNNSLFPFEIDGFKILYVGKTTSPILTYYFDNEDKALLSKSLEKQENIFDTLCRKKIEDICSFIESSFISPSITEANYKNYILYNAITSHPSSSLKEIEDRILPFLDGINIIYQPICSPNNIMYHTSSVEGFTVYYQTPSATQELCTCIFDEKEIEMFNNAIKESFCNEETYQKLIKDAVSVLDKQIDLFNEYILQTSRYSSVPTYLEETKKILNKELIKNLPNRDDLTI